MILGYPNLRNLYRDIQGYPDLPRVSFFQMSDTGLLCAGAQQVVGSGIGTHLEPWYT